MSARSACADAHRAGFRGVLAAAALALGVTVPQALLAQTTGALAGTVRDASTHQPVAGAVVTLGDGRRGAVTDSGGLYRVREVRSGTYTITFRAIGYTAAHRTDVAVRAGETTTLDGVLQPRTTELAPVTVEAPDPVLDPLDVRTETVVGAEDLHQLPVSSLDEAIALSPGAVGGSYRGGRLGEEAFVIDGLAVKNQLDASTGGLGVSIPPDMLTEASLVTNGFSARYGQAISGVVNAITKDGGERWTGRLAYETDRPMSGTADLGLDRAVLSADGPVIGRITAVAAIDVTGRLDADPVSAPAPTDPLDPRSAVPSPLPHNGGQDLSGAAKLTIPFGHETVRVFGLRTVQDRLLYDPAYKYDLSLAPGQHVGGTLASLYWQHASAPTSRHPLISDLRLGYYSRDFVRGDVAAEPDRFFGAFSSRPIHVLDEDLARAQDTAAARSALPGYMPPALSSNTPYGVPAFFLGDGSRGDLAWNHFRELRAQLDLTFAAGSRSDVYAGIAATEQQVRTFQRAFAYADVGLNAPPTSAGSFNPLSAAAYLEAQTRLGDVAFTAGVRYDRFDARTDLPGQTAGAQQKLNPRVGISTTLRGATVTMSGGSFSQAPDYQYLVDAAFDDTTRTGRFREGNPNLGYERAWQYELSVRGRLRPGLSARAGTYIKRLDGLVASVPLGLDPDSTVFGNADFGTVRGAELRLEREMRGGWGFRIFYTLQQAKATSTSAFLLRRLITVDPATHDTIIPDRAEIPLDYDRRHTLTMIFQGQVAERAGPAIAGIRPLAGLEAAVIGRVGSGLPYTKLPETGDTSTAIPNGARLPATATVDALVRRPLRIGGARLGLYLDVRNLLNRSNVVAVRRDTGLPTPTDAEVQQLAEGAYAAHPEAIPYESPRYRRAADRNGDGFVSGPDELMPLYLAAARDYTQPIFAYGAPRQWRFGVEILF